MGESLPGSPQASARMPGGVPFRAVQRLIVAVSKVCAGSQARGLTSDPARRNSPPIRKSVCRRIADSRVNRVPRVTKPRPGVEAAVGTGVPAGSRRPGRAAFLQTEGEVRWAHHPGRALSRGDVHLP